MKFPLFHKEMLIPTILSLSLYLTHRSLNESSIVLVFVGVMIFTLGGILMFLHGVIIEITAHLGIFCFTLKKREKDE